MIFRGKWKGSEAAAWTAVGAWVAFIYLTIPLARAIQELIRDRAGKEVFLWITYLALAAAVAWVAQAWRRNQWRGGPVQVLVLVAVGSILAWETWTLRANPEEAFHFVQYGVLSLLLFRALQHRLRDPSIYVAALLMGSSFGILDELIQWVVPRRYFDYRDIWLNAQAVGWMQVALVAGIRPAAIRGRPSRAGIRICCRAAMVTILLLLFCVSNTPALRDAYARVIPAAARLEQNTAEYGFRIKAPGIGVFFSRLPADELLRRDREEGAAVADILRRVRSDEQYLLFLKETPAHRYPLAVEARIHLFRRDRHGGQALTQADPVDAGIHARIARGENRILEAYFSNSLHRANLQWPEERLRRIEVLSGGPSLYASAVSRHLITRFTQAPLTVLLLALLLAAIVGDRLASKRAS